MTTISEPLQLALTPGAIVPVDVETTSALVEEVRRLHAENEKLRAALATTQEHITDGSPCWCNPELNYVDPDTGAKVWVHKEPQ